jgi:hypothetical protein
MITRERWLENLLCDARALADWQHQEQRWAAPDAKAWENPDEPISAIMDDHLLVEFIDEYSSTFSDQQRNAASALKNALGTHRRLFPHKLIAREVLVAPTWQQVRDAAASFVVAFEQRR